MNPLSYEGAKSGKSMRGCQVKQCLESLQFIDIAEGTKRSHPSRHPFPLTANGLSLSPLIFGFDAS